MLTRNPLWLASISVLALGLSACGGDGGGGVASLPPPPPAPPPPPGAAVSIFENPTVGEFASAGVSTSGTQPLAKFGPLSSAQSDQVHIRYTSSGNYQIQMPGAAWDQLIFEKGSVPADPANANLFQPASAPQNAA